MAARDLATRLMDEQDLALLYAQELCMYLNPIVVAVEDEFPINASMLAPIERDIRAIEDQLTRLKSLVKEIKTL